MIKEVVGWGIFVGRLCSERDGVEALGLMATLSKLIIGQLQVPIKFVPRAIMGTIKFVSRAIVGTTKFVSLTTVGIIDL